jgi:hypothetical protein
MMPTFYYHKGYICSMLAAMVVNKFLMQSNTTYLI